MSNGEIKYRWGGVWLDPSDIPVYPDDPIGYAIPWSRDRAAVIRYDNDTETLNADVDYDTFIRWNVTGSQVGGKMHFHIIWRPVTDTGFIAPV